MSTSKATTSRQPIYVPPNAICKEIPKRWAKNMEALAAVMREILDEVAEEDVAQEWMERFEEVSAQIEELHKFAANMSAEVPEYPEDTEEAIGSGFLTLVALRAAARPKVGGKVRRSQRQLEKAAMTNKGPKDATGSNESTTIEVSGREQGQDSVVKRPTSATQVLGGGDKSTPKALQGTDELCEWCVKRGVLCVWRDRGACESCHEGKKKCNKAGKAGRKCKNFEGPPASLAMTSKKPRTSSVPPPLATSSAPPKTTIHVHPRLVSWPVTLQETSTSAAAPPTLDIPPTTPSISQPPPPLFLPLSLTNTPVPSTSRTEVEPQDDPMAFATSLGSLLDGAPGGEFEADRSGDEGNPETPRLSVQGEDDTGSHPRGSAETPSHLRSPPRTSQTTYFRFRTPSYQPSNHPRNLSLPLRTLELPSNPQSTSFLIVGASPHLQRLAAALGTVEWAKSLMAKLHSGMGQLGLVIQRAKRDIRQLQEWRQDNFEDRR
ncbi:hypothetical protein PISMIDRAFT_9010 [Pisolithus microcarpus 441]|uniref:Uncharacterized protein n=1 Tax=Pisolithus microcarpus 441 TaxID=765257 RepID=A0A0D0A2S5_9AGAM|nr:hypothetical protein PISMIDRAFT_9010 [Pisolithus microcarpus 441]